MIPRVAEVDALFSPTFHTLAEMTTELDALVVRDGKGVNQLWKEWQLKREGRGELANVVSLRGAKLSAKPLSSA